MSSQRYVCVHGHFYQPERENPWNGAVELQPGAYPYHDWNERIAAQCYGANAWSQIRNQHGETSEVVSNYARMSFNFGPTLLSWLAAHAPLTYRAIIAADKASAGRYSGHGSAIAQCYNHLIMPLANRRDKVTQIAWGIADFRHRFGRDPEGMWLPETAVDSETLEILADQGIRYTILAPRQVAATRPTDEPKWQDVDEGTVDTRHPYIVRLASGKSTCVFVFNGPVARAVAFEKLLNSGEDLASRLLANFSSDHKGPQLAHIATDGESYGHHHLFGDMALAYAFHLLERHSGVRLTNYGEFLAKHPPQHEARIHENTAWSCAHGVGRWQKDCGCHSGTNPTWDQKWRAPLREALDWLRDQVDHRFENKMARLVKDPWAARDDYIQLVLSPDAESEHTFFGTHAPKHLRPASRERVRGLLRMQRHMILAYSSCGWFFDDIAGIEGTMILRQAARVVDYARELLKFDPEPHFLGILSAAKSNQPERGSGADVYRRVAEGHRATLPG